MVYVRRECYGMAVKKQLETIGGDLPTNDAQPDIEVAAPCVVTATIEGTAPILFHRWSCEAVAEKAAAAKNSAAKKSDNIESYVYRNDAGEICLPGEYVRMAIIGAARYRQDPRSPRKSAMDLYKAGVVSLTELASLGSKDWDYLDRRRVTVNRSGITRERPGVPRRVIALAWPRRRATVSHVPRCEAQPVTSRKRLPTGRSDLEVRTT
jgi:hypothetical protein